MGLGTWHHQTPFSLPEIWFPLPDKYVFWLKQILLQKTVKIPYKHTLIKSFLLCWGLWLKVSCAAPSSNLREETTLVREKETGEKEGWLKMEEERDFQEGFSWERLLPLDLPSSAQRPAPTLVRMLIAQPITFSYLTCSHLFHYPLSTPLTLFNSTLGRRRVSLLPGPSGREFLARC